MACARLKVSNAPEYVCLATLKPFPKGECDLQNRVVGAIFAVLKWFKDALGVKPFSYSPAHTTVDALLGMWLFEEK